LQQASDYCILPYCLSMGRPLRVDVRGGFYHIIHQGQTSGFLFPSERAYDEFESLLAEATQLHNIRLHAAVLLANSYQLMVETPEANLSQVMQWLNGVYGSWLNRKMADGGSVFHDRFRAVLFDPASALLRVSRHVHLAPIRAFLVDPQTLDTSALQLFDPSIVSRRLNQLRNYRRSSYLAYAGYQKPASWLTRDVVFRALIKVSSEEGAPEARYRAYVEQPARLGVKETILTQVRDKIFLGKEDFIAKVRKSIEREHRRNARPRLGWENIVAAIEKVRGRRWEEFMNQYGDSGRDLALYIGRFYGGYSLKELGQRVGGLGFTAVGQAVTRLQSRLSTDKQLQKDRDAVLRVISEKR
jgi:putative transposase